MNEEERGYNHALLFSDLAQGEKERRIFKRRRKRTTHNEEKKKKKKKKKKNDRIG